MKRRINTIRNKVLIEGGSDTELKNHEIRLNKDLSFTERIGGNIINIGSGKSLKTELCKYGYTDEQAKFIEDTIYAPMSSHALLIAYYASLGVNYDFHSGLNAVILPFPKVDMTKITSLSFSYRDRALLCVPDLDISNATNTEHAFSNCGKLVFVGSLDMKNVTIANNMFHACRNLKYVSKLNTVNVTNMHGMFTNCESLRTIELLDFSSVTNMEIMFHTCRSLSFLLIKNLGKSELDFYQLLYVTAWGRDGKESKQSLIDSLLTYSYDRAANGMPTAVIELSELVRDLITEELISQIEAKGYTIRFVATSNGE